MNQKLRTFLIAFVVVVLISGMLYFVRYQHKNEPALPLSNGADSTVIQNPIDSLPVIEIDTLVPLDDTIAYNEEAQGRPISLRSNGYFQSPMKGAITLSGNFGELRYNHFHAGLDMRTGGQEGADVFAAANGYVSRIKVSERGYGKAIYIQHPNGATTVYGHLQKYDGAIQEAVIQQQYALQSYEMDWYPKAGALKVKQGERIAFSGNTGGSGGPHLHFEIRDGKRGDVYNPLLYGIEVRDVIKPSIKGLQIYKMDEGLRQKTGTFAWRNINTKQAIVNLIPGKYGVAAAWSEYFTDQNNHLGINYAQMEVDSKLVFKQSLEYFAFDEGRFINQHINYYHFAKTGVRYVKMFKDTGNPLRFYSGDGVLDLKPGASHQVKIVIRDFSGNLNSHTFTIKAVEKEDVAFQEGPEYGGQQYMRNVVNTLTSENAKVTIPAYAMYNNFYLKITEQDGADNLASKMIRVHEVTVPLHYKITVAIKPKPEYAKYIHKLILMEYDIGSRSSSSKGAIVSGNMVMEQVKNFAIYYLSLDTVAPTLTIHNSGRSITARVNDKTSDIAYYRGTVDGKWVLFEYELKNGELTAIVPNSIPPGKHTLRLVVRDEAKNETVVEKEIQL